MRVIRTHIHIFEDAREDPYELIHWKFPSSVRVLACLLCGTLHFPQLRVNGWLQHFIRWWSSMLGSWASLRFLMSSWWPTWLPFLPFTLILSEMVTEANIIKLKVKLLKLRVTKNNDSVYLHFNVTLLRESGAILMLIVTNDTNYSSSVYDHR